METKECQSRNSKLVQLQDLVVDLLLKSGDLIQYIKITPPCISSRLSDVV